MRVAYLGTSEFAATVLRAIAAAGCEVALVITPPDRKRGRGRRLSPPPAALAASELGLALHQTASVNAPESVAAFDEAGIDCPLVCAFGQLIGATLLERAQWLNVHPSLLPRWRGAAPIERAIMAGDERTGVTIMRVSEALDAGPVALCESLAIKAGEDFGSLNARLASLAGTLAVRALELHAAGGLEFSEQDETAVTYAEKIDRSERRLDPARSADELERLVRALTPHIGAHLELASSGRLGVRAARAVDSPALPCGELAADGSALALGCARGTLLIERMRPPGGRDMPVDEYLRGHPVPQLA